ncbi:MAG: sugar phosphate isomerase/epimerase, partial [Planctomycetales bacterium]
LCNHVKGLGVSLDPSHFVCGRDDNDNVNYQQLLPFVLHVRLRDTSKNALQVQVGQGEIDYGKIISQLGSHKYRRALSVHIVDEPQAPVDHDGEMRKLRLLLETLV